MRTTPATAYGEFLERWMIDVEEGDNTDKLEEQLLPVFIVHQDLQRVLLLLANIFKRGE